MAYLRNDAVEGQSLRELQAHEIKWKGSANYGIPGHNSTGIAMHSLLLQRHMLFIGSIGSGKSVSMYHVIQGLRANATADDVFVMFDAKGDYYKEFYRPGDYIITNEAEELPGVARWNIFEDILASPKAKRDEVIWEVAAALFREDIEGSSSPIFATGARDLFAAILCAFIRKSEVSGEVWDHEKLVSWIQQATDVTIRNLLLEHKDLFWVRNYISKDNDVKTNQSFFMHLYQNIFNIFSGTFKEAGSFSLVKSIKERQGKCIFLEYDIASGNVLKPIYTLILDIAMKNVLGQKEEECRGNIFFVLDEFPLIPKLSYMDNALNFGRSLGVKVIAGLQNIGQVNNVYTEHLGSSILSGFGTVFAFRLFDDASRSFIINRHGKNKKMVAYNAVNANKGVQDAIIDGSVIEDWDITNLEIGQCIVSPFNGEPFKFYPLNYKKY